MVRRSAMEDSLGRALDLIAARARRVGDFDAYAVSRISRKVSVERNYLSGAESVLGTGIHVRVGVDGRVGGAFCNTYDGASVRECVDQAVKVAKLMDRDPRWPGFASCDREYPAITGIHQSEVAKLGIEVMGDMAMEMVDSALAVSKSVSVSYGGVEASERATGVVNSSGVNAVMMETELQAIACCVAGSGSSVSPECEQRSRSRACDIRMDKTGERAGWVAESSTTIMDARTEEATVLFSPLSLGSSDSGLLNIVLSKALSGQNAMQKTSFLSDAVGEKVWSDKIGVSDNPVLTGRCGSRPFDDEGVPTRKTRLVEKGILKGFVWDSYNGSLSETGSTGNAVRDLSTGSVAPSTMCLQLLPGKGSLSSLISSVDHGYLVWNCQGSHTSNTETGGFSFVASPGLLIEKGEVVGGIRGAMISGNVSDLLSNVEAVGADITDFGSALMPSILFKDVKVTTG